MSYKIMITDLNKLEITKVKPWVICFNYDGQGYMLHETRDGYDYDTSLYKRDVDENGYWKLELISTITGGLKTTRYIKGYGRNGLTYKHMRKDIFVKSLLEDGFSTGMFKDDRKVLEEKEKSINMAIRDLNCILSDLVKEYWG